MFWAVVDICSPIRYETVTYRIVNHRMRNYATSTFRIYVVLLTLGMVLAAPAAGAGPWKPHIRQAASYAAGRAGGISFGVRTDRGLRGVGVERTVPSASVL